MWWLTLVITVLVSSLSCGQEEEVNRILVPTDAPASVKGAQTRLQNDTDRRTCFRDDFMGLLSCRWDDPQTLSKNDIIMLAERLDQNIYGVPDGDPLWAMAEIIWREGKHLKAWHLGDNEPRLLPPVPICLLLNPYMIDLYCTDEYMPSTPSKPGELDMPTFNQA